MSRLYFTKRLSTGQVIDCDDFNVPNKLISEAISGNLDEHNIPVKAVSVAKLKNPTYSTNGTYRLTEGPFNLRYYTQETGASRTTTIETLSLRTATWNSTSWNTFSSASASSVINMKEGILSGYFTVDIERRYGYISPAFTVVEGKNLYIQLGIFLDDVLIAESPRIYPRRYTHCIPFSVPIGTGSHTLDVRWRASSTGLDAANSQYDQDLKIYSIGHSVRNRYN